jgi:hypothetical protein
LRASRFDSKRESLELYIEQAAARQQHGVEAASTALIRASRRIDSVLCVRNDRRIEVGDAFLKVPSIHVILAYLRVQLAQQIPFTVFAGVRLLKGGFYPAVLAVFSKVRQAHLELDAHEIGEVASVGVINLD